MIKLLELKINNFRTIENLKLEFSTNENLFCLIGRGDSGKTTILEAISFVLSPLWNIPFYDSDFYKCNLDTPIEIQARILNPPEKLIDDHKFGQYLSGYDIKSNSIIENVIKENDDEEIDKVITIKLTIDKSLEPKWLVINKRTKEEKVISSNERSLFNCFMISDYLDRHFSWNKGNPLNSILNSIEKNSDKEDNSIVLDSLRIAKDIIDKHPFEELNSATELIKNKAASLGLDLGNTNTTIDFKELSSKDGKVSLHEDSTPFRLKGKGSKRLSSLAIQMSLSKGQGIILIDEIEQGLEPDRIKQLIRTLKEENSGQFFLTTHSREIITELGSKPLLLILKDNGSKKINCKHLNYKEETLNAIVRACPEAFFAKKVIVCEGLTEIGICRELDKYRVKNGFEQMAFKDCAYVDGTGNNLINRVSEINKVGIYTSLFCDSDDKSVNSVKEDFKKIGIEIFDCANDNCIEEQVFFDLNREGINELLNYALITHKRNDELALTEAIKSKYYDPKNFPINWKEIDSIEMRTAIGKASITKDKEWFKRIDHGEFLGKIIFKNFDNIADDSVLKTSLTNMINWIDK